MVRPASHSDAKGPLKGRKKGGTHIQKEPCPSPENLCKCFSLVNLALKSCLDALPNPTREKLICELSSWFSILWPSNKACAAAPLSASVSLLAVRTEQKKNIPYQGKGLRPG